MKFIKSLIVLVIPLLFVGCNNVDTSEIETTRIHGSYVIDVSDKNQSVGYADYVFVAYVNDLTGTVYEDPVSIETKYGGHKEVTDPYTNYSVTVIDNIKGNLKKDTEIPLQQSGGLTSDGKMYILSEHDELLEPDNYYIVIAYAQEDSSLLMSGPYSNEKIELSNSSDKSMLLETDIKSEIMSTDNFKEYQEAYKNEVKYKRKRFKSTYEE